MIVVLWGVSGCGKSTIGAQLAAQLNWIFLDADDFHPTANVDKMRAGIPLTDADRKPWLDHLAALLQAHLRHGQSAVLACSALRKSYRERLCVDAAQVKFAHLAGSFDLIAARLAARQHAFMDPGLLQSQFDTLEMDGTDLSTDISAEPAQVCQRLRQTLGLS